MQVPTQPLNHTFESTSLLILPTVTFLPAMKTILNCLLFCSCLAIGCKNIELSELRPTDELSTKLNPLELEVDMASFYRAYTLSYTVESGDIIPLIKLNIGDQETLTRIDRRIHDNLAMLERELRININKASLDTKGVLYCKVIASDTRAFHKYWLIPSGLTVGLFNVAGGPFFHYKTALDVYFEVRNKEGKAVKRYEFAADEFAKVGLYAYQGGLHSNSSSKDSDAARKANIKAFRSILEKLKAELEKDADEINTALV